MYDKKKNLDDGSTVLVTKELDNNIPWKSVDVKK